MTLAEKVAKRTAKKMDLEAKKLAKQAVQVTERVNLEAKKLASPKKKHMVVSIDSSVQRGVKVVSATTRTCAIARPARYQ